MSQVQIYHNPRCSKSRETLALLNERGVEPDIVLYLQNPPDAETLKILLKQLGFSSVRQLLRGKEPLCKELGLHDETLSEARLLQELIAHPQLIERPIVVANGKARLGRPPEQVLEIL